MLLEHTAVVIGPVQIIAGVRVHRLQLKQVSAGAVRDVLGHLGGVACGGVVHHQHTAARAGILGLGLAAGGSLAGDFTFRGAGRLAGGAFRSGGFRRGRACLGRAAPISAAGVPAPLQPHFHRGHRHAQDAGDLPQGVALPVVEVQHGPLFLRQLRHPLQKPQLLR